VRHFFLPLILAGCGACGGSPTPTSDPSDETADPADPLETNQESRLRPELEGLAAPGFLESAQIPRASLPAPELDSRQQCGRVGALPLGDEHSLLDGRLHIRGLRGALGEARPHSIMAAPAPNASESRLFLEEGSEKVVVMAYDMFALAGRDFVEQVRRYAEGGFPGARVERVAAIGSGLEAVQLVPGELDTSTEAVFVYGLFTITPDRTVQQIAFYVNPAVASGQTACTTLAMRMARTLRVGERRLTFDARTWEVDGLQIALPDRYTLYTQVGPDFYVHRIHEVGLFGHDGASGLVYLGGHPTRFRAAGATSSEGTLVGETVTWTSWERDGRHASEALHQVTELWFVHASVNGPDRESLAPLQAAMGSASLRRDE